MRGKTLETLFAMVGLFVLATMFALVIQTEGVRQFGKSVRGLFFEDLDDVAPGPTDAVPLDPASSWIVSDDYPAEAMRNEWQGTSAIQWTIDRRGRATDCRITKSSGHRILDEAACGAIMSRGRYTPARDEAGRRKEMTVTRRVVWRLPD